MGRLWSTSKDGKQSRKEIPKIKPPFLDVIRDSFDKARNKDMTILMGKLNEKIGADNTGYHEVMCTQGLDRMNANVEIVAVLTSLWLEEASSPTNELIRSTGDYQIS